MARRPRKNVPAVKQVKLKLVHVDFWSAVRMAFMVTLALGIATIVGFILLWALVSFTGLGASLNTLLGNLGLVDPAAASNPAVNLAKVVGFATGLSVFNMVFGSIIAGVWAVIYNVIARFTGGLAVGFTND